MLATGCATIELPAWQGQPVIEKGVFPSEACTWPDLESVTIDGEKFGLMNGAALDQLQSCRDKAAEHYDQAAANAAVVDELVDVHNELNDQGRRYVEHAEFYLNQLEHDRRAAVVETWTYKGIIALVLVGALL